MSTSTSVIGFRDCWGLGFRLLGCYGLGFRVMRAQHSIIRFRVLRV